MTYNEGSDANPVGKFTVRWRLVFIALSMSLLGSVAMDSGASEVSDLIETRADRLPVFDDRGSDGEGTRVALLGAPLDQPTD